MGLLAGALVATAVLAASVDLRPEPESGVNVDRCPAPTDAVGDVCTAQAPELMPLTAEKDAAGTFDRTITWQLDKSVAPASHGGFVGDTFESTWEVTATKTVVEDSFSITGTITITNPNERAVSVEVDDVLDDGTAVTVTCPDTDDNTGTVAANDALVCMYAATPDDASATLNTATVTSLTEGVDGATATAEVTWTPNVIGDQETLL